MRFWPQKKWKKIVLAVFLVLLAAFLVVVGVLEYSVYREVATPTDVLNADGTKTALLIYHPGLTSYAYDNTYAYAEGLASVGWRVEIATASPEAPTDIGNYSLLGLFWPIYDFSPGPTITTQLQRIGDLNQTNTVIVVVAGGMDPFNAQAQMIQIVQDYNGTVIASLQAYRGEDNKPYLQQEASQLEP
ncbi:MAG: hypothetical protein NWF01_10165 [Candidatus Bathyarchaeota archaeon]|nr:hypothetical protein [Candidatus Bathyarchaeota archaeon]